MSSLQYQPTLSSAPAALIAVPDPLCSACRLLATAGCWFLWDFSFYGNKIFQSTFIKILSPNASLFTTIAWTLLNSCEPPSPWLLPTPAALSCAASCCQGCVLRLPRASCAAWSPEVLCAALSS